MKKILSVCLSCFIIAAFAADGVVVDSSQSKKLYKALSKSVEPTCSDNNCQIEVATVICQEMKIFGKRTINTCSFVIPTEDPANIGVVSIKETEAKKLRAAMIPIVSEACHDIFIKTCISFAASIKCMRNRLNYQCEVVLSENNGSGENITE